MKLSFLLIILLTISHSIYSAPTPIGSKDSSQGGTFYYNLGQAPTTLNPLSSTDGYSTRVQGYVLDSLATRDLETYEWAPALATEWTISKDGKVFEFTIREGVKWHDGKPLTAEDIKFSFDAIVHPENKYKTAHLKSYYEEIKGVEILAKNKVRFTAKRTYFKNFDVAAGLTIVPKHIYENPTKKEQKKLNKTLVGTGPYIFTEYKRGKKIILKKNENWWGKDLEYYKGYYNFKKFVMKFVKDDTIAITMTEKGQLDYISMGTEAFMKKATSKRWGKTAHKVKYENQAPKGYAFMGFNLKEPLFASKKTRRALYHLVNRKLMIEKFLFNMSAPATGPLYRQSEYANKDVKAVDYDPKKALAMLREDGWKDSDGDQILDKMIDGKKVKFSFTILEPLQDFIKYLTIFKESAKKAGIDIKVKYVEWNTFIKLLDERKFQAVRLAWGAGSADWDPKQIWHSSSIANSGSNFVGYNNPEVDKLIDNARSTMEKNKRKKILNKVFKIIANDTPYIFFFNSKYGFYGHTPKMKRVQSAFNYGVGLDTWWITK
ncbi:MAG: peptide ABC transporter substrate-binding protein [Bdellovibrionales bacterium]|nr:peptide ABC transporter substrate-binding protein [Bdellovibrionales bacterium]